TQSVRTPKETRKEKKKKEEEMLEERKARIRRRDTRNAETTKARMEELERILKMMKIDEDDEREEKKEMDTNEAPIAFNVPDAVQRSYVFFEESEEEERNPPPQPLPFWNVSQEEFHCFKDQLERWNAGISAAKERKQRQNEDENEEEDDVDDGIPGTSKKLIESNKRHAERAAAEENKNRLREEKEGAEEDDRPGTSKKLIDSNRRITRSLKEKEKTEEGSPITKKRRIVRRNEEGRKKDMNRQTRNHKSVLSVENDDSLSKQIKVLRKKQESSDDEHDDPMKKEVKKRKKERMKRRAVETALRVRARKTWEEERRKSRMRTKEKSNDECSMPDETAEELDLSWEGDAPFYIAQMRYLDELDGYNSSPTLTEEKAQRQATTRVAALRMSNSGDCSQYQTEWQRARREADVEQNEAEEDRAWKKEATAFIYSRLQAIDRQKRRKADVASAAKRVLVDAFTDSREYTIKIYMKWWKRLEVKERREIPEDERRSRWTTSMRADPENWRVTMERFVLKEIRKWREMMDAERTQRNRKLEREVEEKLERKRGDKKEIRRNGATDGVDPIKSARETSIVVKHIVREKLAKERRKEETKREEETRLRVNIGRLDVIHNSYMSLVFPWWQKKKLAEPPKEGGQQWQQMDEAAYLAEFEKEVKEAVHEFARREDEMKRRESAKEAYEELWKALAEVYDDSDGIDWSEDESEEDVDGERDDNLQSSSQVDSTTKPLDVGTAGAGVEASRSSPFVGIRSGSSARSASSSSSSSDSTVRQLQHHPRESSSVSIETTSAAPSASQAVDTGVAPSQKMRSGSFTLPEGFRENGHPRYSPYFDRSLLKQ
ncbi:hypothetical protein PFISCL1PPCAC_27922, partial [Pristionchus fissidentatus]